GGSAAAFAWDGASRPRSPVLGMGAPTVEGTAEIAPALAEHEALDVPAPTPLAGGLTSGQYTGDATRTTRLAELEADRLSDLAAAILAAEDAPAEASIAADIVAHDPQTPARLSAVPLEKEQEVFVDLVLKTYKELSADRVVAHGVPEWLQRLGDRLDESVTRAEGMPGFVLSRTFGELRGPINNFVTRFLGDVFVYLRQEHGTVPGPITTKLLEALSEADAEQRARGGEAIVVLSHSMGGQIVYNAITHYLPQTEHEGIRIDFWCAAASQVGLFEELKLFHASRDDIGARHPTTLVPFPGRDHLGVWWNVWDYNDFLSYTARTIVDGVIDEAYNGGASLLSAHSAYLQRPSFHRRLAERLREAKAQNWRRP
ncbi:MAG TPA: hypothetical protein VFP80_12945, partial [Thermoanaerobaculia bacterium]|nr:hypothetical protein [Thermoanaerobaculia bacterium]